MWTVFMIVDGERYAYGTYSNCNKAIEVALFVQEQRNVETFVWSTFGTDKKGVC